MEIYGKSVVKMRRSNVHFLTIDEVKTLKTREEALRKMRASLCELVIDGIPTNIEEQLRIVEDERFTSGNYDLTFMGNR